jgi:hypothetical protein
VTVSGMCPMVGLFTGAVLSVTTIRELVTSQYSSLLHFSVVLMPIYCSYKYVPLFFLNCFCTEIFYVK